MEFWRGRETTIDALTDSEQNSEFVTKAEKEEFDGVGQLRWQTVVFCDINSIFPSIILMFYKIQTGILSQREEEKKRVMRNWDDQNHHLKIIIQCTYGESQHLFNTHQPWCMLSLCVENVERKNSQLILLSSLLRIFFWLDWRMPSAVASFSNSIFSTLVVTLANRYRTVRPRVCAGSTHYTCTIVHVHTLLCDSIHNSTNIKVQQAQPIYPLCLKDRTFSECLLFRMRQCVH